MHTISSYQPKPQKAEIAKYAQMHTQMQHQWPRGVVAPHALSSREALDLQPKSRLPLTGPPSARHEEVSPPRALGT